MQTMFKQWWSTIPPISTKQTVTSHLKPFNIIKTTTYGIGNPSIDLKQAQKCGRVKLVTGIPTLLS